jgi:hypothetical protein
MFVWFVLRDSNGKTWFSGLETPAGTKKPAYGAFSATAKGIDGQQQMVSPHVKKFSVTVDVPFLTYHDSPGAIVGVTYRVWLGRAVIAAGQPRAQIASDQTVSFPVKFQLHKGYQYLLTVDVGDKHGQHVKRNVQLVASS